jgi:DNA-binding response OmpR family regulator
MVAGEDGQGHFLRVDPNTRLVTLGPHPLPVTPAEFRILELLASHPAWVYSPAQVAASCLKWGGPDTINVHVSNLRRKAATLGLPPPVENVRGFGYRLAPLVCGSEERPGSADDAEAAWSGS